MARWSFHNSEVEFSGSSSAPLFLWKRSSSVVEAARSAVGDGCRRWRAAVSLRFSFGGSIAVLAVVLQRVELPSLKFLRGGLGFCGWIFSSRDVTRS
jgi:hypothetical protein